MYDVMKAVCDPARLAALHATKLLATPPEAVFDRYTRLAAQLLDVPVVLISLVDSDHQFFKSATGLHEPYATIRRTPVNESFCQHVVATEQTLVIDNALTHPLVCDNPAIHTLRVVAYLGAPLKTHDGFTIGSLCAIDSEPRHWTLEQISRLGDLAAFVGSEFEARRAAMAASAAEKELQELQAKAAIQLRFRLTADAMPQIVWTAEPDGARIYYNRRWFDYTGLTFEQSRDWAWKSVVHPDDLQLCLDQWTHALKTGTPQNGEYRMRRGGDGEYRWHLCRSVPNQDTDGRIVEWVGIDTDIHDQKVAQAALERINDELEHRVTERTEELRAARESAESANEAKSDFLANMSHEIRTPISAIVGFSDLMLRPNQTQAEMEDAIHTIRRNAAHLLDLINDILDLSKIEAGKMDVERTACDVPKLLAEVMSSLRPRAAEKKLKFDVKFQGAIPRIVQTDSRRARQILINLVGNALKFTEQGSVSLNVKAERIDGKNLLRVDVKDSGIGMSGKQLDRLFQPFTQADESTTRRFGGTGLGLTISRKLARSLGGEIAAQSAAGIGSVFTMTIDCGSLENVEMLSDLSEKSIGRDAERAASPAPKLGGRILLVDDGRDNQRLLSMLLKAAGATVSLAENGQRALEEVDLADAAGKPFDLIFMDMQMPVMDGYTAAAELRRRGCKLPIIALTAHAMAEDRARCLKAGCSEYASKPINHEKLIQMAAAHMSAARAAVPEPAIAFVSEQSPTVSDQIRSALRGRPHMDALIDAFIHELPGDIARLQTLVDEADMGSLKRFAHELRGAGGGYGFDVVTKLAGTVEDDIVHAATAEAVENDVKRLIDVMGQIISEDRAAAA